MRRVDIVAADVISLTKAFDSIHNNADMVVGRKEWKAW